MFARREVRNILEHSMLKYGHPDVQRTTGHPVTLSNTHDHSVRTSRIESHKLD